MANQHHDAGRLAALGREWVAAWNSRDLERVLALYAEDSEMTSDKIPALGFDAGGTLRGKENLRAYWGKALALLPHLHFTLIDTYVSPRQRRGVLPERAGCEDLRIPPARCGGQDQARLRQSSGALASVIASASEATKDPA